MAAETEERQRKEEELRKRLQEAQEASENGTIQLYKKMAMENAAREAEIAELRYIYYLKYQVYKKCLFVRRALTFKRIFLTHSSRVI